MNSTNTTTNTTPEQKRINKAIYNAQLQEYCAQHDCIKPCTLMPTKVITPPPFTTENYGVIALMFLVLSLTAEKPDGHPYNPNEYQSILRLLPLQDGDARLASGNGTHGLLFHTITDKHTGETTKIPDAFAWPRKRVRDSVAKGYASTLDVHTEEGDANVQALINLLADDYERELLSKFFYGPYVPGIMLIEEPKQHRYCIDVDEEFLAFFNGSIVESYVDADEDGCAVATDVVVGDRLIVSVKVGENGEKVVTAYSCKGGIFNLTYRYGHI